MEPIDVLLKNDHYYNSFAVGVLLFAVIDSLGGYLTKKKGFKNRLDEFLKESDELTEGDKTEISKKITDCFRNGIIHNGRVKESCQFDYDFEKRLFVCQDQILIINNKYLKYLVINVFNMFIDKVKKDENEMKNEIKVLV